MNTTDYETPDNALNGPTLVATFATRDLAHEAVSRLHDEGFHKTWIGITSPMEAAAYSDTPNAASETRIESDNAIARFFGAGDESLSEALLKHGVSASDAARVDGTLPANSAIVTVEGANHPELAAQIVNECGGTMVSSSGSSKLYDTYATDRAATPDSTYTGASATQTPQSSSLTGDRLAGLGDYRDGEKVDEARRLQLREERLAVDKSRVKTGEATVGKEVVTEQSKIDVPVMHEELYIERRPASGTYGDAGTIGEGETIRVPLEKEVVNVTKQAFVTEEVLVGQRRVDGVEHVSETLKKEQLTVDDKTHDASLGDSSLRDTTTGAVAAGEPLR